MKWSEPILVAEDDAADLFLLQRAMRRAGVGVRIAFVRDGEEVIDYLRRRSAANQPPPELLLLDLKMPRMDGFEVLEQLQHEPAIHPRHIVVFSTCEEPADVSRAAALGVEHYLVKPTDTSEMTGIIRRLEEYWTDEAHAALHPDGHARWD